jgi:hypothetical protein
VARTATTQRNATQHTAGWVDSYRRRTGAGPLFAGPKILTLIALRTGFIVLFLLCNHKPQNTKDAFHGSLREGWPTPFTNDAFPVIFMILFAVSNGFCGTVCMMSAPQIVSAAQGKQASTPIHPSTHPLIEGVPALDPADVDTAAGGKRAWVASHSLHMSSHRLSDLPTCLPALCLHCVCLSGGHPYGVLPGDWDRGRLRPVVWGD